MRVKNTKIIISLLFVFAGFFNNAFAEVSTSTDIMSDDQKLSQEFQKESLKPVSVENIIVATSSTSTVASTTNILDDKTLNTEGDNFGVKFKKGKLSKEKLDKMFAKLDKIKKKDRSQKSKDLLSTLKSDRKNKYAKYKKGNIDASDLKNDATDNFAKLKALNDQINKEKADDLKNTLTPDELNTVDNVEGNILFSSDDIFTPTDTYSQNDWALNSIVSEYPNIFSTTATLQRPVLVAVIDSGVDYNNDDLKRVMWNSPNCVDANNLQIAGGCTNGYDFVSNDSDPAPSDGFDHGTAVATLIAASTDNGLGISSLSQNRAKIMSLRVADSGFIDLSNVVKAIYFAVNNGADVINMSLSGPTYSQTLYDALAYAKSKGVIVVVSSGNNGFDLEQTKMYPASYNLDNIIVVGSMDNTGAISTFSNYGTNTIDVIAPGRDVMAGTLGNTYSPHTGTSFSAPIMTALVARWISEGKNVLSEINNLDTNANYLQKTISGKTLSMSKVLDAQPIVDSGYLSTPAIIKLPDGTYLDQTQKGGVIVASTTLQLNTLINDKSIGVPTNISPGSLDVNNPTIINSTTVTFYWTPATGAKIYGFYLTDNSTGGPRIVKNDNVGIATSYTVSNLVPGKTYRWNVGAGKVDTNSNYNLSALFFFKVAGNNSSTQTTTNTNVAPAIPINLTPNYLTSPGLMLTQNSVSVSFSPVANATSYYIYWRDLNTNKLYNQTITGTTFTIPNLILGDSYRWNMQAVNSAGTSNFSATNYFYYPQPTSLIISPTTPVVSIVGTTTIDKSQTLTITANATSPIGSNLSYEILWDAVNNPIPDTNIYSHKYSSAGTYCIKVTAIDSLKNRGQQSACTNITVTDNSSLPDLTFAGGGIDLGASKAYKEGDSVNFNLTFANVGTTIAPATNVGVYLNQVQPANLLGQFNTGGALAPNQTKTFPYGVGLPASGSPLYSGSKDYQLIFVLDYQNQIGEVRKDNNQLPVSVTINRLLNGKSFSVNSIANQKAGTDFAIQITSSGYSLPQTVGISAEGNISSINSVTVDKSPFITILKLNNSSSATKLRFTIGSDIFYSNAFNVQSDSTSTNDPTLTIIVKDRNNNLVPNANVTVYDCLEGGRCVNGQINLTTSATGTATVSYKDIAGLFSSFFTIDASAQGGNIMRYKNAKRSYDSTLQVTINNLTDDIHDPIILIPGIMGSTLGNAWIPIPYLAEKHPKTGLYISDIFGTQGKGSLGWEAIRVALEKQGYVRGKTIIDCPYDWRESVDVTANTYFSDCMSEAQRLNPGKKINVIAHSLGGLVTRAYIQSSYTRANQIGKIAFLGTPMRGSTDAYYAWEGGDAGGWTDTRYLVTARTYSNEFNTWLAPMYLNTNKKVKDYIHTTLSTKQLLPDYKFLMTSASDTPKAITNPKNVNELLIALNGNIENVNCPNNLCAEGSYSGVPYMYNSFVSTLANSGIKAMMFSGEALVNPNNKNASDFISTRKNLIVSSTTSIYEDGTPIDNNLQQYEKGDTVVPITSTKNYVQSLNRNDLISVPISPAPDQVHAWLPLSFKDEAIKFIMGPSYNASVTSLNSIATSSLSDATTSILSFSASKNVNIYLTDPNGKGVGINPNTGLLENNITNIKLLNETGDGNNIAIDNPIPGAYKIYISGNQKGIYKLSAEYLGQNKNDSNTWEKYYDGISTSTIVFTLK